MRDRVMLAMGLVAVLVAAHLGMLLMGVPWWR